MCSRITGFASNFLTPLPASHVESDPVSLYCRRAIRSRQIYLFLRHFGAARSQQKFHERPAMTQTTAAFASSASSIPMILFDHVNINVMFVLVLYYRGFNNQSYDFLDFSLSIGSILTKMAYMPFCAHRCVPPSDFCQQYLLSINKS